MTRIALLFVLILSLMAFSAQGATIVISPSSTGGWAFAQETGTTGTGSFANGPGAPPLGTGSAHLGVTDAASGELLYKANNSGAKLSEITELSFSTFSALGGGILAPTLQFGIDADVTDANFAFQGRLVYEPYLAGTAIVDNTWQQHNPLTSDNGWWFTNGALSAGCSQGNSCSFAEVLAFRPNIGFHTVFGFEGFKVGSGWVNGLQAAVDAYTIGTQNGSTTYNFEGRGGEVPEPATYAMMGAGLLGIAFIRRRRA